MPGKAHMVKNISGKTGATGATGAVSGASIAPLIIWILGQFGIDMPPEVAAIVGGLVGTIAATLIAWLVPATSGTYVHVGEPVEDYDESDELDWDNSELGSMADYASGEQLAIEGV